MQRGALVGLAVLGAAWIAACGSEASDATPTEVDSGSSGNAQPDAASSSSSSSSSSGAFDSGADSATCEPPAARCGEACVDLQTDPAHCGTCDHACAAGAVCLHSTCMVGCTIDGGFHPDGAANPADPCQVCRVAESTTTWSSGYRVLLTGGSAVELQGWTITMAAPASIGYSSTTTQLQTTTADGAGSGGQLLLSYPDAVTPGHAFKLRAELRVDLTGGHNQFDASAALLGSFTAPAGSPVERAEMVYLDAASIGWADDSQSAAAVTGQNFHVYELAVDAAGNAAVTIDGAARLTRTGFVTNGIIAVGDQSTDAGFDAITEIRSIGVCEP